MGDDDEGDWIGTAEAAKHLGISTKLFYKLVAEGEVPAERRRKGRTIVVRRRDLDAYLQTTRIQPGDLTHLSTIGPREAGPANAEGGRIG